MATKYGLAGGRKYKIPLPVNKMAKFSGIVIKEQIYEY